MALRLLANLDYMKQQNVGGVCRYIQEVLPRIAQSSDIEVDTFTTSTPPHPVHGLPTSIRHHIIDVAPTSWRLWFTFAPRLASHRFRLPAHDILWLPVPTTPGPKHRGARIVVTVHDVGPIAAPDLYPWHVPLRWKRYLSSQLALADGFVVPSEFTKDEMMRYCGIPEEKIAVVPHGTFVTEQWPNRRVDATKDGNRPFEILYIGPLFRKKGSDTLLKAFQIFHGTHQDSQLTLVGQSLALDRATAQLLNTLIDRRCARQVSKLRFHELIAHYRRASVVVCPSRYEGFGLPVLEAMYLGVPVICSRIPAFEEVAGKDALYFATDSFDDLVVQMETAYNCRQEMEHLATQGKKRAALFSWERSAESHRAVFRRYI